MAEQEPRTTDTAPQAQPRPEPLERVVAALPRPLTLGVAAGLTVLNLVVLASMINGQNERLDRIESIVSSISFPQNLPSQADPEACWLVGAAAYAQGRGKELVAQLSNASIMSDCVTMAHKGAMGEGM